MEELDYCCFYLSTTFLPSGLYFFYAHICVTWMLCGTTFFGCYNTKLSDILYNVQHKKNFIWCKILWQSSANLKLVGAVLCN